MLIPDLNWFILGVLLSAVSVRSIKRTVSILFEYRSMKTFWIRYTFRLCIAGLGLLLAVQWGVKPILIVFFGFILFRYFMLIPKFARLFSES